MLLNCDIQNRFTHYNADDKLMPLLSFELKRSLRDIILEKGRVYE